VTRDTKKPLLRGGGFFVFINQSTSAFFISSFQVVAAEGHPAHPPPLAPGHAGAAAGASFFEP
jgi:hypothetical protein